MPRSKILFILWLAFILVPALLQAGDSWRVQTVLYGLDFNAVTARQAARGAAGDVQACASGDRLYSFAFDGGQVIEEPPPINCADNREMALTSDAAGVVHGLFVCSGDFDLFYATHDSQGWSAPEKLPVDPNRPINYLLDWRTDAEGVPTLLLRRTDWDSSRLTEMRRVAGVWSVEDIASFSGSGASLLLNPGARRQVIRPKTVNILTAPCLTRFTRVSTGWAGEDFWCSPNSTAYSLQLYGLVPDGEGRPIMAIAENYDYGQTTGPLQILAYRQSEWAVTQTFPDAEFRQMGAGPSGEPLLLVREGDESVLYTGADWTRTVLATGEESVDAFTEGGPSTCFVKNSGEASDWHDLAVEFRCEPDGEPAAIERRILPNLYGFAPAPDGVPVMARIRDENESPWTLLVERIGEAGLEPLYTAQIPSQMFYPQDFAITFATDGRFWFSFPQEYEIDVYAWQNDHLELQTSALPWFLYLCVFTPSLTRLVAGESGAVAVSVEQHCEIPQDPLWPLGPYDVYELLNVRLLDGAKGKDANSVLRIERGGGSDTESQLSLTHLGGDRFGYIGHWYDGDESSFNRAGTARRVIALPPLIRNAAGPVAAASLSGGNFAAVVADYDELYFLEFNDREMIFGESIGRIEMENVDSVAIWIAPDGTPQVAATTEGGAYLFTRGEGGWSRRELPRELRGTRLTAFREADGEPHLLAVSVGGQIVLHAYPEPQPLAADDDAGGPDADDDESDDDDDDQSAADDEDAADDDNGCGC